MTMLFIGSHATRTSSGNSRRGLFISPRYQLMTGIIYPGKRQFKRAIPACHGQKPWARHGQRKLAATAKEYLMGAFKYILDIVSLLKSRYQESMMLVIQRNINEIRDKEKRYPVSIMANSSVINLLSGEPGWETRNFDAELQKFQEKNIKEEEIAKIFGVGKSELPLKKRMMRDMVRKLMEMAGENIQKKK